jgi:type II secretory pathway component PulF
VNGSTDIIFQVLIVVLLIAVWLVIMSGILSLLHFLLSLPMRRAERARTFLDLVDTALCLGEPVEQALVSISQSREQSLGVRFHLFVGWLERGLRLHEALAKVPRLLPPAVVAMLKAGQQIGDLRKVLAACRQLLADSVSETRSALNYLVVIAFVVSPATMFVFLMTATVVFPKFIEVGYGMGGGEPTTIRFLMEHRLGFVLLQAGLQCFVWSIAFAHIMGPHLRNVLPGYDRLQWLFPWRRKRMQRDFSAMLATLLDAHMPEPEAVTLAAECTANVVFQERAARVTDALRQGHSLTDALEAMDDTGEFRWRMRNAAHSRGGFLPALSGWHDALNAKAFQQEQAAAHVISTTLVLINGVFVGTVVIAVFAFLISIVNTGILW